jgi:hypothetical protein
MDMTKVLSALEKGLKLLPSIVEAGEDIASTVEQMVTVAAKAKNGTVTAADVTALETHLDQQIADFNSDMPPET